MLKRIHLKNVGPASELEVNFSDRLNIFTGDNGLGKTFLLDIAWWVLGHENYLPLPKKPSEGRSAIDFEFTEQNSPEIYRNRVDFVPQQQMWLGVRRTAMWPDIQLGIYAKADGSFSIFDSLRAIPSRSFETSDMPSLSFSTKDLWNGLRLDDVMFCNGLVSDWVRWQNHPDRTTFNLFWSVIKALFPAEEQPIEAGTVRLSLQDVRDIPTIQLSYGQVPITHLSAGMKRIISLAYSLVWTWYEHQQAAILVGISPSKKLMLFIDEMEVHLHPQWQRSIFPAILEAIRLLSPDLQVQVLTTTHSPLVLASLEPFFDEAVDTLFGLEVVDQHIALQEFSWTKLGDVDRWLTSPIFGLSRPRSKPAEIAINAAYALMRNADMTPFPNLQTQDQIHHELMRTLPDDDPFWHRWIVTAEAI